MIYGEPRTVGQLLDMLSTLPRSRPVRAFGPSSMTTMPLYVQIAEDGAVELLGDEMARPYTITEGA